MEDLPLVWESGLNPCGLLGLGSSNLPSSANQICNLVLGYDRAAKEPHWKGGRRITAFVGSSPTIPAKPDHPTMVEQVSCRYGVRISESCHSWRGTPVRSGLVRKDLWVRPPSLRPSRQRRLVSSAGRTREHGMMNREEGRANENVPLGNDSVRLWCPWCIGCTAPCGRAGSSSSLEGHTMPLSFL